MKRLVLIVLAFLLIVSSVASYDGFYKMLAGDNMAFECPTFLSLKFPYKNDLKHAVVVCNSWTIPPPPIFNSPLALPVEEEPNTGTQLFLPSLSNGN